MTKKILVTCALLLGIATLQAQEYNWGVGIRGGAATSGVTLKYNFDPANAIEAIIGFTHGTNIYALYEHHVPVIAKGFNFYYGGGVNVGSWDKGGDAQFTMGVSGIIGLEYKIPQVPLALAIDYKPTLNFSGHGGLHAEDLALSLRVTF